MPFERRPLLAHDPEFGQCGISESLRRETSLLNAQTDASGKLPHCSCGHTRNHHLVSPECKYSGMGWFWVIFGVTTRPKEVTFRCRKCGERFETTRDPVVLAQNT